MNAKQRAEKIYDYMFREAGQTFSDEMIPFIAAEIEEAGREAVGRELQERMLNLCDSKSFDKGYSAAREKAAKDLRELVESNYDEYRDDCGFCGATLTKCPKWCMRNDLIEFSEALKTMKPDSDVSAHEVSNGENKR